MNLESRERAAVGQTMRTLLVALPVLGLVSCAPSSDPALDPRGTYDVKGRWSIGGPLSDGRTPGELAADLLIEEAVALSPVPGTLEDDARDALAAAIRESVAAAVDANMPPELREGGVVHDELSTVLSELDVESTLTISDREALLGGNLSIEDDVTSIAFTERDGSRHVLALQPAASFGAEGHDSGRIEVRDHEYSVSYAELVRWAVEVVLAGPSMESLAAGAGAAVPCSEIASEPVEIEAGGVSITVTTGTLETACEVARSGMVERVLGLFEVTALVIDDGELRAIDDDGDGRADRIESRGDYGGAVAVPVLPDAISPQVVIALDGVRS